MRQKIIAGNWKMNGNISETESLLNDLLAKLNSDAKAKVIVCPPYISLLTAHNLIKDSMIALGAQDMSVHEKGAYTAEISAEMLLTVGAQFVILGHSERRQYHSESDELVNAKTKAALKSDLTPIICVGETLEQRESGATNEIVGQQINGCLKDLSADELKKIVIAYEPVWAIGTGKTATPEMAQEVHRFIRNEIKKIDNDASEIVPILYGGSVKPDNAAALLNQPDLDGALVGGASLKADDFNAIIDSV